MSNTSISFKRIQQLALPAMVAGVAEPLLSLTDAAVVGNIPITGTEALAAVGIVGSFLSMLIWVLGQTRAAIATIIAQNLGAGKIDELGAFPAQAIYINVVMSLLVLVSTYFFAEQIFTFLNAENQVLQMSLDYYSIRVWGFPLTLLVFGIFGVFRGLQNTFWPMIIAILGAGVNIGLDFLLVYGWEGWVTAQGLTGAAWASLCAQLFMAVLSLILLLKKTKVSLRLYFPLHHEIRRLVPMSLNLFVRAIALNAALLIAVREATALGKEQIAAHAIAINIWLFSAFFIDGYGAAGNLLSGKLLGGKEYNRLLLLAKRVNLYNVVICVLLMLGGFLCYEPLGRLFNKDPLVLEVFYSMFYLVLLCQPLNAVAFTFDAIFKGLGEMRYLRDVLLGATLLAFLPVLYLCRYLEMGLTGIWIALLAWVFYRGAALVIKFMRKFYPLAQNQ
ncbi:MATE family efflux transporter [Croceiramulus getboli]|nr:MATE family efflux transporter [Flavobacteriaceae bacterium YJPT1-3]